MTFGEMADRIARRFSGDSTIARMGMGDDVTASLNDAQEQVAAEITATHGLRPAPGVQYAEGRRAPVYINFDAFTGSDNDAECLLPAEYHWPVVHRACQVLAEKNLDLNPKLKVPERMAALYRDSMATANRNYALWLSQGKPNRMVDAYRPDRHVDEEF